MLSATIGAFLMAALPSTLAMTFLGYGRMLVLATTERRGLRVMVARERRQAGGLSNIWVGWACLTATDAVCAVLLWQLGMWAKRSGDISLSKAVDILLEALVCLWPAYFFLTWQRNMLGVFSDRSVTDSPRGSRV